MSKKLTDSLTLITETPEDELRYFFSLARGVVRQRLTQISEVSGPRPPAAGASAQASIGASIGAYEIYSPEVARLRLLEEMILEQLPSLAGGESSAK